MSSPTRNQQRGTSPKKLTFEEMRFSVSTGLNASATPFKASPRFINESKASPGFINGFKTPSESIPYPRVPDAPRKQFRGVSPKKDTFPFPGFGKPLPPPLSTNDNRFIQDISVKSPDEIGERLNFIASLISSGIKKDQLVKILSSQKYPLPLHLYRERVTMLNLALEVSDELADLIFSILSDFTNEEMSLKFAIVHKLKSFASKLSEKNIRIDMNAEDNPLVLAVKMRMHNVVSNLLQKIRAYPNYREYLSRTYPWNEYKFTLIQHAIANDDESTLAALIEHGARLSESLENKVVMSLIKQNMSPNSKLYYLLG